MEDLQRMERGARALLAQRRLSLEKKTMFVGALHQKWLSCL